MSKQHFTRSEVEKLISFAQDHQDVARIDRYAHAAHGVQHTLSQGLLDPDKDYSAFADAYLQVFDGASVEQVAKDVYPFLDHKEG